MGPAKVTNSLNKTIHLTGIGLAVQAFYINLTLDSALGGEYLQLAPAGPPVINPTNVWDVNGVPLNGVPVNGVPVAYGYNQGGINTGAQRVGLMGLVGGQNYNPNGIRDQNGYYVGDGSVNNGYLVGRTYAGGRENGVPVTYFQGNAYGDVHGQNPGFQAADNGNKPVYYVNGLGHGGVVQQGLQDQRYRDGAANIYGGGVYDPAVKTNAQINQAQFGVANGYRGTNNGGGTVGNANLYRRDLIQGAEGNNGAIGSIASQPILIQQTVPVIQRPLPTAPASTVPLRNPPQVVSNPNRYYAERPGVQNVLVAAV